MHIQIISLIELAIATLAVALATVAFLASSPAVCVIGFVLGALAVGIRLGEIMQE
jgi:hypothetical protein